jgi:molecular chaperone GrpE
MKQNSKAKVNKNKDAEYQQRIGELTEALQRLQAEFENYKKRQAQESAEAMSRAKEMVLSELLPALDNFDLAASHLPAELEGNSWAQGMQYVGQQLTQKLDDMGVKKIVPMAEEFDHNLHEAIEHVASDKPEGIITDVITPGYQIGERVVRPARVKVSGGSNNSKESNKGE